MIETITFNGKIYPKFQQLGNAAQFVIPFTKYACKGIGFDVGYKKEEWKLPGAIGIDINMNYYHEQYHALHLPNYIIDDELFDELPDDMIEESIDISLVDFIFSSHCLEHIPDWVTVLDYWMTRIKTNGTLFLYLPDYSQEYWRPFFNRKHLHVFTPEIIKDYFESRNDIEKCFISGVDLNNSFCVMIEKK